MARTFGSITYECRNFCGTFITFHRDDHLPTAPWECEACLDAATEQQIEELWQAAKNAEAARMAPQVVEWPIRIKRISDFN